MNSDCANCGHSHSYDGPLKPVKPILTVCWKCGCRKFLTMAQKSLNDLAQSPGRCHQCGKNIGHFPSCEFSEEA